MSTFYLRHLAAMIASHLLARAARRRDARAAAETPVPSAGRQRRSWRRYAQPHKFANPYPNDLGGYVAKMKPLGQSDSTIALSPSERFRRLLAAHLERATPKFVQKQKPNPYRNLPHEFQSLRHQRYGLTFHAPTRSEARAMLKQEFGLATSRGFN